jgi:hypothetical protein
MPIEASIETLVERIEANLVANPAITGISVADNLEGQTSATQKHGSARVQRVQSVNTGDARDAVRSLMEDEVDIESHWQLPPKDQKVGRAAIYALARSIRNRITSRTGNLVSFAPQHISDRDTVHKEWLTVLSRIRFLRYERVGQG